MTKWSKSLRAASTPDLRPSGMLINNKSDNLIQMMQARDSLYEMVQEYTADSQVRLILIELERCLNQKVDRVEFA